MLSFPGLSGVESYASVWKECVCVLGQDTGEEDHPGLSHSTAPTEGTLISTPGKEEPCLPPPVPPDLPSPLLLHPHTGFRKGTESQGRCGVSLRLCSRDDLEPPRPAVTVPNAACNHRHVSLSRTRVRFSAAPGNSPIRTL